METRGGLRRAARGVAAVLLALAGLLAVEALLARRGPQLDPFPPGQLDGTIGAGAGPPLRLVWLGDSTGDGVGASSPSRTLPHLVASGLGGPASLTVLAVSGSRVVDGRDDQLPKVARLDPDIVVVALGSNDVVHLTSRRRLRSQLRDLLAGVAAAGPQRIVVLGPGQFAATPRFAQPLRWVAGLRARGVNDDVRAAAREHGALFVDIIARVGADFVRDPKSTHAIDRFHPNDEGYALWARATLDAMREAGWIPRAP